MVAPSSLRVSSTNHAREDALVAESRGHSAQHGAARITSADYNTGPTSGPRLLLCAVAVVSPIDVTRVYPRHGACSLSRAPPDEFSVGNHEGPVSIPSPIPADTTPYDDASTPSARTTRSMLHYMVIRYRRA